MLQRLHAARAAADCDTPAVRDALTAILLGDHPDVQRAALQSLGPSAGQEQLIALLSYGEELVAPDSPGTQSERESLADMPPGLLQVQLLIHSRIHSILEKQPGMQQPKSSESRLVQYLQQSLHQSRSAEWKDFPEATELSCLSLDSLALLRQPATIVFGFTDEEKERPAILACGLLALARYEWAEESALRERIDGLAQLALSQEPSGVHAARVWYSRRPELTSLSRVLENHRSTLPFSQPVIRALARSIPGNQGRIRESTPLYSRPYIAGPVIRVLSDGEAVDVLRKSRNYNSSQEGPAYLIRTQDGLIGWISSRHLQTE